MSETPPRARVLVVDDDDDVRLSLGKVLDASYEVLTAADGEEALRLAGDPDTRPDLVLLDVRMPGLDGYEVCARIQLRPDLSYIPVVFVTVLDSSNDHERAFAVGAADYLEKPFERDHLLAVVEKHLAKGRKWQEVRAVTPRRKNWLLPATYDAFRRHVVEECGAVPAQVKACNAVGPEDVYSLCPILRISQEQMARYLARFLDLPYLERVQSRDLALGVLPRAFCASNLVLPLVDESVVAANPFDWDLMDVLERTLPRGTASRMSLTEPDRIRVLCRDGDEATVASTEPDLSTISLERADLDEGPASAEAMTLVNEIIRDAVAMQASDVHFEPKDRHMQIRYRLDGDMQDMRTVDSRSAARALSRLKALAGMDIAERRKPQDGALMATLGDRHFKLRLATSSTTGGETLVLRLLEPEATPVALEELGMTPEQGETLRAMADRHQGLIIVVGPTGSGKSTTIFTLLCTVDGETRSIMTVEDPVEYRIPHANQQQVRERAGVTFEALLRSAMRQDPDILFLGEIRDPFSARAALEFSSTGHLTISTLHSSNATTAIFRLERLGIERSAMSDAISGVLAQKLIKKLCPQCKEVGPPTRAEVDMLTPFTDDIPAEVARPKGCPACRDTGYRGRAGVYELVRFDPEVAGMVRDGDPISEIRSFCAARGDYLIGRHALDKVRDLDFAVKDAHENVLLEELMFVGRRPAKAADGAASTGPERQQAGVAVPVEVVSSDASAVAVAESPVVLVVDDDEDLRALLELHLKGAGYRVDTACDGVEALLSLGQKQYDLVLSDINMPNLDGMKLMEMITQKGIDVPTIFLTGDDDEELEGRVLDFGAVDYIRKPVRKDVLLPRIRRALKGRGGAAGAGSHTS